MFFIEQDSIMRPYYILPSIWKIFFLNFENLKKES